MPSNLTEADLYEREPGTPWRVPVRVVNQAGRERWACRICVRTLGQAAFTSAAWPTSQKVAEHIDDVHPDCPKARAK